MTNGTISWRGCADVQQVPAFQIARSAPPELLQRIRAVLDRCIRDEVSFDEFRARLDRAVTR